MKVLFIGGTGFISTAVSRQAIARGVELYHLNRGQRPSEVSGVKHLTADVHDSAQLQAALQGQQFDVVVDWIAYQPADIERDIWDKMAFLAPFAGLTALMRLPIGRVREDVETRAMLRDGLAEALAVARARNVALPDDFVERTLARCDRLPYEMKSSMLQDLERGRRLELPWLSGALVRLGRELGVR